MPAVAMSSPMFPGPPTPTEYDIECPWNRQPFDTFESYTVFQTYLLEPKRPRPIPQGKYRLNYEAQAWQQRALAWDEAMSNRILAATEETRLTMAERHAKLGLRFQAVSSKELAKLERASDASKDIPAIREGTVYRYAEVGIRIEREATNGAPPEQEPGLDLSKLSVEELRVLRELTAKAQK